jgi:hypothetical protein
MHRDARLGLRILRRFGADAADRDLPLATTSPGTAPLRPVISVILLLASVSAVTAVTDSDAFCSVTLVRSAVTTISGGAASEASGSGAVAGAGAAGVSAAAIAGQAAINARMETLADPTYRFLVITLSPNLGRNLSGCACQRLVPGPHPVHRRPPAVPPARPLAAFPAARRVFAANHPTSVS